MNNESKQTSRILSALGLDSNTYKVIVALADHVKVRHIPTKRIVDIRF